METHLLNRTFRPVARVDLDFEEKQKRKIPLGKSDDAGGAWCAFCQLSIVNGKSIISQGELNFLCFVTNMKCSGSISYL